MSSLACQREITLIIPFPQSQYSVTKALFRFVMLLTSLCMIQFRSKSKSNVAESVPGRIEHVGRAAPAAADGP